MSLQARYTILRKIADGGTAEIFLATQKGVHGFEKTVVLKRIFPAYYADPQFRDMLVNEAHIAMSLNHSNIVQVLDLGEAEGQYILALELVDGWTLDAVLRRARAARATLPPAIALYLTAEVCRALAYAHAKTGPDGQPLGIVHRDISPHNVLLSEQGEVKLTDFGIATSGPEGRETGREKVIKGKIAYMSPEQASGARLDARSDLFSVGTMLYVMICRRYPFDAPTDLEVLLQVKNGEFIPPETARPGLNPEVYRVLKRAMAKAPADRYQRAEDMLLDVEQVMRVAFRAVGQTELKRWLGDLSARDGVAVLTKAPALGTTAGAHAETIGETLELEGAVELAPAGPPAPPPGRALAPGPPAGPPAPPRARPTSTTATAVKPPPPLAALAVGRRTARAMPVIGAPASGGTSLPPPSVPPHAAPPAPAASALPAPGGSGPAATSAPVPAPPAPSASGPVPTSASVPAPLAPGGSGPVATAAAVPAPLAPGGSGTLATSPTPVSPPLAPRSTSSIPVPPPLAPRITSSIPVPPPLASTLTPPPLGALPPRASETAAPATHATATAPVPAPAAETSTEPVGLSTPFTRRRLVTAGIGLLGVVVLIVAIKASSSRRRDTDRAPAGAATATTSPAKTAADPTPVAPAAAAPQPPVGPDAAAAPGARDSATASDGLLAARTVGSDDAKRATAAPDAATPPEPGSSATGAPTTAAAAASPADATVANAPPPTEPDASDADGAASGTNNPSRDAGGGAATDDEGDDASAKARVTLEVTSTPPGARVGTPHHTFGVTPVQIRLKPNNTYALTFTRDGYRPLTKRVQIADGPAQEVSVTLRKAPPPPPAKAAAPTAAPAAPAPPPAKAPEKSWFQQMFSR